jgi:ribonuclease P protein component
VHFRYPSHLRLKSRKEIQSLFSSGKKVFANNLMAVYRFPDTKELKVAISVPKKKFKRAVDRNRVKRLIREELRLRHQLFLEINVGLSIMYIYNATALPAEGEIKIDLEKINSVILDKLKSEKD